jgi:uncharacterized protein YjcR
MDSGYRFDSKSASRANAMREPPIRLKLTTADIGELFGVKAETVRQWIAQKKLRFTGDNVEDFLKLVNMYQDYLQKQEKRNKKNNIGGASEASTLTPE